MPIAVTPKNRRQRSSGFIAEQASFRRHFKSLLRRYPNEFVALCDGKVLGHDIDDEALAERMFTKLGHSNFGIFFVSEKPEIHEFGGPEPTV